MREKGVERRGRQGEESLLRGWHMVYCHVALSLAVAFLLSRSFSREEPAGRGVGGRGGF